MSGNREQDIPTWQILAIRTEHKVYKDYGVTLRAADAHSKQSE